MINFEQIPGLQETKDKLIGAVKNNHLAHALLFHGPEGSSNLLMALALSTYLLCENPGKEDACGECPACQKMSKLIHPDLNFAIPQVGENKDDDEDQKDKKIDFLAAFRKFVVQHPYGNISDWIYFNNIEKKQLNISKNVAKEVIRAISLKSFEGGYKIMLIWAPEFLHVASANALLKILEEPPANTIFLLVTSRPEQLLTTILSRTQKIMVRAFTNEEIKNYLIQKELASEELANQVVPFSDGNLRLAIKMAAGEEDHNIIAVRDFLRKSFEFNVDFLLEFIEELVKSDKENIRSFLNSYSQVVREVLLSKSQLESLMRSPSEERDFLHKLAVNVMDERKLSLLYQEINDTLYYLERNGNPKILMTDLAMKTYKILKMQKEFQ
jgi:DNA polymerase III subunit delta'